MFLYHLGADPRKLVVNVSSPIRGEDPMGVVGLGSDKVDDFLSKGLQTANWDSHTNSAWIEKL